MRLFDSHAHLGAPEMRPHAAALLSRAREAGVSGIIAVGAGYGLEENTGALELAAAHDDVWAAVGVHPHDADAWDDAAARCVDAWLDQPRVVAVGETGLDYWYERSPREAQRESLRGHVRIARTRGLPLVIHVRASRDTRDAFEELLTIFDEEGADRAGGVIHCFTGDRPFAEACLARGFDISFSGILTFRNADALREVAAALPLDRLLVETDSPLLAPVPHRGRTNEPAWVREVVVCLAALQRRSPESVAAATDERARLAFRLRSDR